MTLSKSVGNKISETTNPFLATYNCAAMDAVESESPEWFVESSKHCAKLFVFIAQYRATVIKNLVKPIQSL